MVLEMSLEEQMERIRGRHEGNQDAVQMMKVPTFGPIYILFYTFVWKNYLK